MVGELISGIAGIWGGAKQRKLARKQQAQGQQYLKDAEATWKDYQTPQEMEDALTDAKNDVNSRSAIQSYLERQAEKASANNLHTIGRAATSGAQALAMANQNQMNEMSAKKNAAIQGANERDMRKNRLAQIRGQLAEFRDKEWDVNVQQKYLQKLAWGQQLQGAGLQNQFQSYDTIAKSVGATAKGGEEAAMMAFGGGAGGGA